MADDEESLDDILSTSATPEVGTTPPEAEQPQGVNRDEHGRFAPKAGDEPETEQPEGEQEHEEEPEGEHNAPVAAVRAERQKRQAETARAEKLERDLSELRGQMSVLLQQRQQQPEQPKPEPKPRPQLWDDPDNWGNSLVEEKLSPFQEQLQAVTFRASRAEAIAEHGKEAVQAAQDAIKQAIKAGQMDGSAVKAQLSKSHDPVGDVVRWHQGSPAVQEASMREKLRAELMAEFGIDPNKPQPTPSQPSNRNPVVKLPPSLNRIPSGHSVTDRDESLDEILAASR